MSANRELPSGWEWVAIADLSLPGESWNPRTSKADTFSYIDIEAVDNKRQRISSPKTLAPSQAPSRARVGVKKGDILFSLVRPYLKNVAVVPEDLDGQVASTAFLAVRPAKGVDSSFVFNYLLQDSFINSVPTYGNSPPAARDDEFVRLKVPLAPSREQQRIASKVDELLSDLDAGVAALERARANLKRYRAAVLKAAVEGRLTAEWRKAHPDVELASQLLERILAERRRKWEEAQLAKFAAAGKTPPKDWKGRYPDSTNPETINLPALPARWCWATMDQLIMFGPQNGLYMPQAAYGSGIPILRIDDFQNTWSRSATELRLVRASVEDSKRYTLEVGDIVINRVNSLTHLGKCLVIEARHAPALFESNMMRMRCSELCIPDYLVGYLRSVSGNQRLVANAKWAVNQASISRTSRTRLFLYLQLRNRNKSPRS